MYPPRFPMPAARGLSGRFARLVACGKDANVFVVSNAALSLRIAHNIVSQHSNYVFIVGFHLGRKVRRAIKPLFLAGDAGKNDSAGPFVAAH